MSGILEDCLRTESGIKNSMVRHPFCLPISIATIQTNPVEEYCSTRGCSQIQLQAHPTRLLARASVQSRPTAFSSVGTRLLSQILSAPTCRSSKQSGVDRPTAAFSEPNLGG